MRALKRTVVFLLLLALFSARADTPGGSQQRAQVLQGQASDVVRISYLLFLPADYEKNAGRRWPLILYLHGGSLRGSDIESVRKLGLPHKLETDPNFPFVVASPQCPPGEIWTNVEALGQLLDRIQADYRIDPDRVYVTGHSMGDAALSTSLTVNRNVLPPSSR